jgi:hypothetical protein
LAAAWSDSASGSALLPISGWVVQWRPGRDGHLVVEVLDSADNLVGMLSGTDRSMVTVDGAWRGTGQDAGGARAWWTLAMGHATDTTDQPVVTFGHRADPHRPAHHTVVPTARRDGLWFASVPGRHAAIAVRQGAARDVRPTVPSRHLLIPVPTR